MLKINNYLLKNFLISLFIFWIFIDIVLVIKLFWSYPNYGFKTIFYKFFNLFILLKMIWINLKGSVGIAINNFGIVSEFWLVTLIYGTYLLFCAINFVNDHDYSLYLLSALMRLLFGGSIFLQACYIHNQSNSAPRPNTAPRQEGNQGPNFAEAMRIFNEQLINNIQHVQRQTNTDFPPPYSEILNSINVS